MENRQSRMTKQKNSRTQVLLLGCNAWDEGQYERSDSIIVVSLDRKTGKAKLASILRDIWVDFHERGMEKINSALVFGGPEYAMQVINECFRLDIRHYAVVDMRGFVHLIDLLGGIDVEITELERVFLNCWVRDLAMPMMFNDGIVPPYIEKAGMVHMDGRTALSHARNRTIGTDFARTDRQRVVLKAMVRKIREECSPLQRIGLFLKSRKYIRTNLSPVQIAALCIPALKAKDSGFPSIRIPVEHTYKVCRDEQWHFEIDFEENAKALEQFFSS